MRAALLVGSRTHLDLESVRLDRQRFLQLHLVTVDVNQLESLQDHANRERCLVHRETAANTGALAVAERLPGIDRTRGLGFRTEVLRVEGFGVRSPDRRIAV